MKTFYIVMTSLVAYQIIYNIIGAYELGGKYTDWTWLLYEVGSLIPAILVGVYACRLAFAKVGQEKDSLLQANTAYIVMARIYCYLFIFVFLVFVPLSGYVASFFDQLALQYISSFHKSMGWMARYFVGIQFSLATILSFVFLINTAHFCCRKGRVATEL